MDRRKVARRGHDLLLLMSVGLVLGGLASYLLTGVDIMPRLQPLLASSWLALGLWLVVFRREISELYRERQGLVHGSALTTSAAFVAFVGVWLALGGFLILLASR